MLLYKNREKIEIAENVFYDAKNTIEKIYGFHIETL